MIFLCIITQSIEYLEAQRTMLMSHPAYPPDFSPYDLWLFLKITEQLCGKNFQDMNELYTAVQERIKGLRKEDLYPYFEH